MQLRHTFLVITFVLAGCGTTSEQWQQLLSDANNMNAGQRNYFTDPITAPVPTIQPNIQPYGGTNNQEYRTVMVNTPNGIVYKRCKVLNGQNVACF